MRPAMKAVARLRRAWRATSPRDEAYARAIRERWKALPERVRHPAQMLGRNTTGCEGTSGVFPACNFSCAPCYHSKDANHVPVDARHTLEQVDRQMRSLSAGLGTPRSGQHCQLIGGEVTLLGPRTHAAALRLMQRHGRIPMSFTHGDFDADYLERLADEGGGGRRRHLAFAAHFDTTMHGRRGLTKARSEAELHGHRARFCGMFRRLREERGVTSYLAHNMTVTPRNVGEVAEVVRAARHQGWSMLSFQPAAYMGVSARWKERFELVGGDDGANVWREIERGAGRALPYQMLQTGDARCNRTVWGLYVGDEYHPLLEEGSETDRRWRDSFLRVGQRGGSLYDPGAPPFFMVARLLRALLVEPRALGHFVAWAARLAWRCGPLRLLTRPVHPMTFVMHRFMDAENVAAAHELQERGVRSDAEGVPPKVRETMERLDSCFYMMAQPDGRLLPACVQHSVVDPGLNARLRVELGGEPPVERRSQKKKRRRQCAAA